MPDGFSGGNHRGFLVYMFSPGIALATDKPPPCAWDRGGVNEGRNSLPTIR